MPRPYPRPLPLQLGFLVRQLRGEFGVVLGERGRIAAGVGRQPGRMRAGVDLLEHPNRDLGVNLRRLQFFVAEELLDETDAVNGGSTLVLLPLPN